jgi:hypothetical protein
MANWDCLFCLATSKIYSLLILKFSCIEENVICAKNNKIILDEMRVNNYNAIVKSQGGSILFSNTKKGLL